MLSNNTFSQIVHQFAQAIGFDAWDWMAVLVSIVSLYVAAVTLKSQKHTEKNTQPLLDKGAQLLLFMELFSDLFNLMYRCTVAKLKREVNSSAKLDMFSAPYCLLLPEGNIHMELFYASEYEFLLVNDLDRRIREYNRKAEYLTAQALGDGNKVEGVYDALENDMRVVASAILFVTKQIYIKDDDVKKLFLRINPQINKKFFWLQQIAYNKCEANLTEKDKMKRELMECEVERMFYPFTGNVASGVLELEMLTECLLADTIFETEDVQSDDGQSKVACALLAKGEIYLKRKHYRYAMQQLKGALEGLFDTDKELSDLVILAANDLSKCMQQMFGDSVSAKDSLEYAEVRFLLDEAKRYSVDFAVGTDWWKTSHLCGKACFYVAHDCDSEALDCIRPVLDTVAYTDFAEIHGNRGATLARQAIDVLHQLGSSKDECTWEEASQLIGDLSHVLDKILNITN